jgi:hypothetical protein
MQPTHVYEVRPRKDHRGIDLISDALPFGRLWYGEPKRGQQRNRLREASQFLTRIREYTVHAQLRVKSKV